MNQRMAWARNALVLPVLRLLRDIVFRTAYAVVSHLTALQPNSVILVTVRAGQLTDNLLCLYNQLDKEKYKITQFSFARRPKLALARLVPNLRFICAMAQTQYTIVDDFLSLVYAVHLRPGARLVQVWHALGAFKRVGYSRQGHNGGPSPSSTSHKNYTDVIVSSDAVREDFAEAFGVPVERVHATGVPRSDLFFDQPRQAAITTRLYERLPVLRDRRVVLFAPTFRGNQKQAATYPADFFDLNQIGAGLGEHDLLVLRMHPFVRSRLHIPAAYRNTIIDLSDYPEFNDLLLVSNVLVTDYSSAIFDYSLLRRPIIFYVPDLDTYTRQRGFYYPFETYAYGPVVRDMTGLLDCLPTVSVDEQRLRTFNEFFLNRCDGQATQRCLEAIFSTPAAVR